LTLNGDDHSSMMMYIRQPMFHKFIALQDTNNKNSGNKFPNLARYCFWMGKLYALLSIVKTVQRTILCTLLHEQDLSFNKVADVDHCQNNKSNTTMEKDALLDICENLIFQTLPHCHAWLTLDHAFIFNRKGAITKLSTEMFLRMDAESRSPVTTNASSLISDAVNSIVESILLHSRLELDGVDDNCDNPKPPMKMMQVHLLFIRWLSPSMPAVHSNPIHCNDVFYSHKDLHAAKLHGQHPFTHELIFFNVLYRTTV